MNKIDVFNKKKSSKIIEDFAQLYCDISSNVNSFAEDSNFEIRTQFLYLISRYVIHFYDVNYIQLSFEDSGLIDTAYCEKNNVVLTTGLLKCKDFETFLFQSILSLFHEVNHIYINNIEDGYTKGLDGQKNINFSTSGASSIIEYFKSQKLSADRISLLKDLLYLTSVNEKYAFYSSTKLGLKFIAELRKYLKEHNLDANFDLLDTLELKLNDELAFYIKKFQSAKFKNQSLINQLYLKKTLYDLEEETIFELLSNKDISENKYDAFLTAIQLGIYEEKTLENYKKAILINKMGINKAKLFCDLINIPTYKITEKDLVTALDLIEKDDTSIDPNDPKTTIKLNTMKTILHNIDAKLIEKIYKKMKGEKNERLS